MAFKAKRTPAAIRRRLAKGPLYYGWIVVGACFLLGAITSGTIFSFGVFFGYIVDEFGLSHANTSVIFSLQAFVTFSGAALLGFVIDRYGAPRLLGVAAALVVVGLYGVTQLGSFAGVLFSYGLVAAAGFSIAIVVQTATPNRWFDRRRGFALGITTAGAGVGIIIFPPIVEFLIQERGWRGAYGSLMLAFLATYIVVALLLSDRPSDLDLNPAQEFPAGMPEQAVNGENWRSQLRDAVTIARKPVFALMFLAVLFLGTPGFVITVSIVEFTADAGLGRTIGVLAISVMGATNIAGKLGGGALSDRIGRPSTLATSGLFMGVGIGVLLGFSESLGVLVAAGILGFGVGINAGLFAPTVADLFGTININTLVGLIVASSAISGSLAPYLAGLSFDLFGTYRPVFLGTAVIAVIGGSLVWAAVRLQSREPPATPT